jgi:hypothetical protein
MASQRKAEVVFIGDAASIVRAAQQAEAAVGRSATNISKHHATIASSFSGMAKRVAGAAVGFAAAYASIEGVKGAVDSTEQLAETTIKLTRVMGLNVQQASAWASVAKVNDLSTRQLSQAFGTLSKNSAATLDAFSKGTAATSHQAEAFKQLGISQKDLIAGKSDFQGLLDKVNEGFQKLPAGTEKAAIGMTLMGRGWQTLLPLMRQGALGMDGQLKMAKEMGATFEGKTVKSLEQFRVAQEKAQYGTMGLQLAIGQYLAPALTKVMSGVASLINGFRNGTGAGGALRDVFGKIVTVGKDLVHTVSDIVGWFQKHQTIAIILAGAIAGITVNIVAYTVATKGAAIATGILTAVMEANPFVLAATAIAAVAGALVALELKTHFLEAAWNALKSATTTAWNAIKGAVLAVTNAISKAVTAAWNGVKSATTSVWRSVSSFVSGIWNSIKAAASSAWNGIKSVIGGAINGAFSVIKSVVNSLKGWLTSAWGAITGGVKSFASGIANGVVNAVKGAINAVISFINDIIGVLDKIPFVSIGKIALIGQGSKGAPGLPSANSVNQATGAIPGHAKGALVTRPMFMVGEEAPQHKEVVLSTNPAYGARQAGLLAQYLHMAPHVAKKMGIPGFSLGGIFSGIGSTIGGAVSGAVNTVANLGSSALGLLGKGASFFLRLLPDPGNLPSWVEGIGHFLVSQAGSWIKHKVTGLFGSIFGGGGGKASSGGGSPAAAQGWTAAGMALAGVSGPLWMKMLLRQEGRESTWNPAAINNWDSNAKAGNPSEGILQTTLSTFAKYKLPGHGNILNAVDNIAAAIRYMIAQYGHGNPDVAAQVMWARGGGAYRKGGILPFVGAYANGGVIPLPAGQPGLAVVHGQEMVVPGFATGGIPSGAVAMLTLARELVGSPYSKAGHSAAFNETIAAIKKFGTDCSGFVSRLLKEGGSGISAPQVTSTLPSQGGLSPGAGKYVTVFDRPNGSQAHTLIEILGHFFESGGNSAFNPSGGISELSAAQARGELAGGGFQLFHPNRLATGGKSLPSASSVAAAQQQARQNAIIAADQAKQIKEAVAVIKTALKEFGSKRKFLFPTDAALNTLNTELTKLQNNAHPSAKAVGQVNTEIAKLTQYKAFKDAIANIRSSLKDLASQAAQTWRSIQEARINSAHDAAIAAINNSPAAQQLAAMQAQDAAQQAADQLASLQQAVTDAQFQVDHSGGQDHVDALNQLKQAQQALTDFQRQQDEQRLQDQIDTATKAADQTQQTALDGLDKQTADYQQSLQDQLNSLTDNLAQRKETYRQWAKAVNKILAHYGLAVPVDSDTETTIDAGPGTVKSSTTTVKNTSGGTGIFGGFRASGGPVRPGYVYRVGEHGPEDVVFGRSGTVLTANQTARRGGWNGPLIGIAHFHSARQARAFADRLAHRAAIGTP